jgi:hypothetical protein
MKVKIGSFSSRVRWVGAVGAILFMLVSLGSPARLIAQGAPLTLTFGPGRDAVQAGTVTITPQGDTMVIVVNMTAPNPAGNGADQLNHIHTGKCPGVGAVVYPFTNIVNGTSTTTVNASLASVSDGNHSINVHQGTAAPASGIYTACVDIPASGGAAPAAAALTGASVAQATARAVPSSLPNTGVGPGPVRQGAQPSAAQVTVSAAPQLPSTGTGGLLDEQKSPFATGPAVALLAAVVLLAAGAAAWRRRPA